MSKIITEASTDRPPHVAYVLLWYPIFTQPFIFREVEGLKKTGLPVSIYSLYAHSKRKWSEEMRLAAEFTHTFGIKAIGTFLWAFFSSLLRRPLFTLKVARQTLLRRRLGLESAAENLWGFLAGFHLACLFRESGIDIIHAPWPRGPATAAWVASLLSGIPFSIAARGDNLAPMEPDLPDKMKHSLFIRANNRADMLRMRNFLPEEHRGKIDLVYNSLTLAADSICPVPMTPPTRLLAVGRFSSTKGFDYLLQACKILKDKNFPFHLTLVGGAGMATGGYYAPLLIKMRHTLGLKELVDFPGVVSHDRLPGILAGSDIFMAPCVVNSAGEMDGIPNAIIEAMSFGLPVISTRVNAIPEIVIDGETGVLVPQKDAESLAAAIERLAQHPEKAREMAARGRILALEMFAEKNNVPKLKAMFKSRFQEFNELTIKKY